MKKFAVMGNPIAHSLSPEIHQQFARQAGVEIIYKRILVGHGEFAEAVRQFADDGGYGLNITVPFKHDACAMAKDKSPRATRAGAVNTLMRTRRGWFGDNTDGVGLINDIVGNLGYEVSGARILVIGAGGAVRGVLEPLLNEQPQSVVIANRTVQKAVLLSNQFADLGNIRASALTDITGVRFDLVINATSAGLSGQFPFQIPIRMGQSSLAYDMVYGDAAKGFLEWANRCGATRCVDGLGMLVGQAAESFRLWHGIAVDSSPVIEMLRENKA